MHMLQLLISGNHRFYKISDFKISKSLYEISVELGPPHASMLFSMDTMHAYTQRYVGFCGW